MKARTRRALNVRSSHDPLPIRDEIDERAREVWMTLIQAWHTRQDTNTSESERARAIGLIDQLWRAAKIAPRGPRGRLKELVLFVYEDMRDLAGRTLEEYRAEEKIALKERRGVQAARIGAKAAAISVILERLAPDTHLGREARDAFRAKLRKKLEQWRWRDRREDGLARDLTALHLEIAPESVRVLKYRARHSMKGGRRRSGRRQQSG